MARTLVLGFSLAIICLLAFLTISVAIEHGDRHPRGGLRHRARAARDRRPRRADHAAAGWLGIGRHRSLRAPSSQGTAAARRCRG